MSARANSDPLASFHPAVADWFRESFTAPTRSQTLGWPAIARGDSTLILAPTGSGKTLAAFLWCLNRLMFAALPDKARRCRVLYVSPLKALAVDVERNLRAPLAGIARVAQGRGDSCVSPTIAVRTGDTPASDRARFQREPADILITTPESLYLLLTSNAREALGSVDTIIIDEIHALVPTKRGSHLAISVERLAARCARAPQRIGLSATQRPLDEVARFLGGAQRRPRAGRPPSLAARSPSPAARRGESMHAARARESMHAARTRDARGGGKADRSRRSRQPSGDGARDIGAEFSDRQGTVVYRPVTIVDAGANKTLALRIEVPVEDMARLTRADDSPSGPASVGDTRPSIWSAIHPRLLELINGHRSTLIFVNSRRLAERLAGALNELAGETLVRSHHGSIAREQRVEIEDRLKAGALRALVATSSLELGIDMGAIDLVIQIEAPPSVTSGLQRIGRGGHQIEAVSEGIIFPKFRGDLVACAAVAKAMHDGAVEASRYPRNPLDIVAQQIVAMTSMDAWQADDLFSTIRQAAPCAELSRGAFDGVLDMLSGRYPSDEFAELKPRVTWDRGGGMVTARQGARRVAIANGGTIPDRGLYGVFLVGAGPGAGRVGELDEEMVFESSPGETFVLGASSWRIEEITHDRVLVSPAPGQHGKMPFWKGDRTGRPLELGLAIGTLMHDLVRLPPAAAIERLTRKHDLDGQAAENLLRYLRDQLEVTGSLPDAGTVIVERVRDELGDWRICVLSPRGGRIHAPWAMAASAKIREETGIAVETLWGDDGFVVRFPDMEEPPEAGLLLPDPDEVYALVVRELGGTALFAAKFRENAGRSLLLPKRRAGMRAPLWQQRKRAADLLAVASRYGSFPVLLETYRECLRDVFDMPALVETLSAVRSRSVRVVTVDSKTPSPFASSLLFSYVASFLYDGDAPLGERRAHALAVDQTLLRELLGDAQLRELLDLDSMEAIERQLQRLEPKYHAKHADGLHDMLLSLGDLTADEIGARAASPQVADSVGALVGAQRVSVVRVAGEARYIAVEDAARYRDALGTPLPQGIPESLLSGTADPLGDLALRFARTHAPFPAAAFANRYGLTAAVSEGTLARLSGERRLLEGEFRPDGSQREWTDAEVLGMLRRRSLARLRHEVEPVDQRVLGRFSTTWQGLVTPRRGADGLLDVIEQLQGAPLPASILETDILPARLESYDAGDLDAVVAAGEVVWVGLEPLGERDGRIALYLADHVSRLLPPRSIRLQGDPARQSAVGNQSGFSARESAIIDTLGSQGASFFGPLHQAAGAGYPGETVDALWNLVWRGFVTNDTMHALRALTRSGARSRRRARRPYTEAFRSRRLAPPLAEGRWSLVPIPSADAELRVRAPAAGVKAANMPTVKTANIPTVKTANMPTRRPGATNWVAAVAQQLLARHGVLTREAVSSEAVPGGFSVVYPVLRALEDAGRLRRGYFIAGLGATQFALPGAVDLLRSLRDPPDDPEVVELAATDPANPYGATLRWPALAPAGAPAGARAGPPSVGHAASAEDSSAAGAASTGRGPTRSIGATVILVDGALAAYLARGDRQLLTWLPDIEPQRARVARAVALVLVARARGGDQGPRGMLVEEIDGLPASAHVLARFLVEAGFVAGAMGLHATATGTRHA